MKLLISFILLVGGTVMSVAQSVDVIGGFNVATITGEPGHTVLPGFYLGVGKDISISKQVSFRPELYYSRQGAKGDLNSGVTFHYIQMPLYFNFTFGKLGVALGPQVAVLKGGKYKDGRDNAYSILPITNKFDLLIGGGPFFRINERLRIDLRVVAGVMDFTTEGAEELHNFMIQGGVSWTIKNESK